MNGSTTPTNNGGSGSAATEFTGKTAVFVAGMDGTSTFTVDGDARRVGPVPVVYRNGGGDTDMSPEQGGASGRLELNDDDTAAEAFGLGGVTTYTAPVLESVAVAPTDPATLTLASGETNDNDPDRHEPEHQRQPQLHGHRAHRPARPTGSRWSTPTASQGDAGSRTFLSSAIVPATTPATFAVDTGADIADIINVNGRYAGR